MFKLTLNRPLEMTFEKSLKEEPGHICVYELSMEKEVKLALNSMIADLKDTS